MFYYIIICQLKKVLNDFYLGISYILILMNIDYGRNNKCYFIIIHLGGGINYMLGGTKFLNTGLIKSNNN
jgi:hypothetical protein